MKPETRVALGEAFHMASGLRQKLERAYWSEPEGSEAGSHISTLERMVKEVCSSLWVIEAEAPQGGEK